MSGLCGWLEVRSRRHAAADTLQAMAQSITRFDGATVRTALCAAGGIAAAATDAAVDVHCDNERLIAVWGHIRCAEAEKTPTPGVGIARAVLDLYAQRGAQVMQALAGEFAIALLDGARGEALLAVDRMATRPLYYTTQGGALVFGSSLDALGSFFGNAPEIDPQALYDYVHFHMVPGPRTIQRGRCSLLPGTCLRWRRGNAAVVTYWEMQYVENDRPPVQELESRFIDLLHTSVRDAAGEGPVGAFLSGGTDSSTIAGMLRDVTGQPPRTYSIGFEAEGYDEMAYARIAARHFGASHHEYYVTPDDVVAAIPNIAAVHDQPFGNSSAVPTYYCAALAKADGVTTLLGGDGGDELFGGNDRYAKQYLYSLYGDLPLLLRRLAAEPIAALLPPIGVIGQAKRYMRNASAPMPDRYDNYNLLQRLGPQNVFTPDFLHSVDPGLPQATLARDYQAARAQSLINRMLALDLKYTLADNDLPKVTRACELAGVAARFPMLDDRLVAFSARLAPELKLRGTTLRWFFKKALRGFLPDEIIHKRKHGFGLPFGLWLQSHGRLRDLAFDSLGALKQRHIVRPALIDELVSDHLKAHPSYFATLVWVFMMLELWLARRAPASVDAVASPRRRVCVTTAGTMMAGVNDD